MTKSKAAQQKAGERAPEDWQVYLLECSDKTLYCGVTNNLSQRLEKHNQGLASKYTRSRRPVTCVAASPMMAKSPAFQLEYRIKQLPAKRKKDAVLKGQYKKPA